MGWNPRRTARRTARRRRRRERRVRAAANGAGGERLKSADGRREYADCTNTTFAIKREL